MKYSNMKTKLLLFSLLTSTLIFSQINEDKLRKYYLIDKLNDTSLVYGKILSNENLSGGFAMFDKNGNRVHEKVNPDSFKYLLFSNSDGKTTMLKSLPFKKEPIFLFYDSENVFMSILIENTEEELKKGKIDFYTHEFTAGSPSSFGPNGFSGYTPVNIQIYYFKDLNGLHQIKNKSHFKSFPEILGVELYKKMKNSDKEQKEFLLDYFTAYNNSVEKLNPKQ